MDIVLQIEEIKARFSGGLSSSDKHFIERYYERVLFKSFNRNSCNSCYNDAFIEMYTYIKKYGLKDMGQFILKRGVILQTPKESTVYTNQNLTDQKAIEILKDYPSKIIQFESYPDNWEELLNEYNVIEEKPKKVRKSKKQEE